MVDAVYRAFRRRPDPTATLLFAVALPPLPGGAAARPPHARTFRVAERMASTGPGTADRAPNG